MTRCLLVERAVIAASNPRRNGNPAATRFSLIQKTPAHAFAVFRELFRRLKTAVCSDAIAQASPETRAADHRGGRIQELGMACQRRKIARETGSGHAELPCDRRSIAFGQSSISSAVTPRHHGSPKPLPPFCRHCAIPGGDRSFQPQARRGHEPERFVEILENKGSRNRLAAGACSSSQAMPSGPIFALPSTAVPP